MGCARCGAGGQRVVFADRAVHVCASCHALRWEDLDAPRRPTFRQHLRCLQEEIAEAEKEPEEERVLEVHVVSAERPAEGGAAGAPGAAVLRVQVVDGDPRWVQKGSVVAARAPVRPDGVAAEAEVTVRRRHKESLVLAADAASWARLPEGARVEVVPRSSAQIQRTLLQAYLHVRKSDPNHGQLEDPATIPRIPRSPPQGLVLEGLRPAQARAVQAAFALRDDGVLLVQGPPGTGKTTVIASLVRNAVKRGQSVLVASHTHVAIDNALRRLLKANPLMAERLVRIGDVGSVAVDMVPHAQPLAAFVDADDGLDGGPTTVATRRPPRPLWRSLFEERPVAGMTLDALAHAVVRHKEMPMEPFDFVVVDEAGMNLLPKLAVARAAGRRLVLVGDHQQLPPIVTAPSFRADPHYRRSPFEVLQAERGDLLILLDEQFRCHPRLYEWSAECVYEGRVASRRVVPAGAGVPSLLGHPVSSPVVWVDTAAVPGNHDERVETSRVNRTHVAVCARVVQELVREHGFPLDDVGVITPFRRQAELYGEVVRRLGWRDADVLASTVDAFQGDERKAIVFDLTSRGPAKPHEDPRRLNVSLTRAQDLLVVVGARPFARSPAENPWLWSLERWATAQVVPFPAALLPRAVQEAVAAVPLPRHRKGAAPAAVPAAAVPAGPSVGRAARGA